MSSTPPIRYKSIVKHILLSLSSCIALFTASCGGLAGTYEEPVNEYFRKYTETAAIGRMDNRNVIVRDLSGAECISSESDKVLFFYLRNPQGYRLNLQFLCAPDGTEASAPAVQLVQNDRDRTVLSLTYSRSFLLEKEGGDPIGGTITLVEAETLREFDSYSYSLKCNTPPPGIQGLLMQTAPRTDNPSDKEYVLCFFMPTTALASTTHNKDTHFFHINDTVFEMGGSEYSAAITTAEPSGLETSIDDGPEFIASRAPAGYTAMYYRTGIALTTDSITYSIHITDDDGLSSKISYCNNKTEKLEVPEFTETDGTEIAENTESSTLPVYLDDDTGAATIKLLAPTVTTSLSDVSGVTIRYTITDAAGEPVVKTAVGNTNVQIYQCGTYTITATAEKDRYIESESVTRYIKVKRGSNIYVAENGSNTSGNGTKAKPFAGTSKVQGAIMELENNEFTEIHVYVKGKVKGCGTIGSTVTSAKGTHIYIQNTPGTTGAVLDGNSTETTLGIETSVPVTINNIQITGAKQGEFAGLAMSDGTSVTLQSGVVIGKECSEVPANISSCANKGYGIKNEGGTLTISGAKICGNKTGILTGDNITGDNLTMTGGCINYNLDTGLYTYSGCKAKLTNVEICGNTSTSDGGGIYFEDGSTSIELTGCTIKDNSANQGGGIYSFGGSVKLTNCTVQDNTAENGGGGIWIQETDSLELVGSTRITGNTATSSGYGAVQVATYLGSFELGGNVYIPYGGSKGNNDLYIDDPITVTSPLQNHGSSDRIRIVPTEYVVGKPLVTVADGVTISAETVKFDVTQPMEGYNIFCISSFGKIDTSQVLFEFPNGIEDGSSSINPANNQSYDVVKYSYLTNDNLKMNVTLPTELSAFTMQVTVDSTDLEAGDVTGYTLNDGYHMLYLTLEKPDTQFTIPKRIYVRIKQVKAKLQVPLRAYYGDSDDEADVKGGGVYVSKNDEDRQAIRRFDNSEGEAWDDWQDFWPTANPDILLDKKTDAYRFSTDNLEDWDNVGDNDDLGSCDERKTLTQLKADNHWYIDISRNSGKHHQRYEFYIILTDNE